MRYRIAALAGLLVVSMHTPVVFGRAALPVKNGRPAVATVNRDVISLDELLRDTAPSADRTRLLQGVGTADDLALLDRLISIRLIVQEAATMGLDEMPEIRKQVDVTSREILREVLIDRLVKDIVPDQAAIEKIFKEAVREWKTTSLLLQDESVATRVRKEITDGTPFTDAAARAVAAKVAKTDSDTAFHSKNDYLPQIAAGIASLQVGQVTPVIRLQAGFVIVRVADIRYPENAEARAAAKKEVLSQQQVAFLKTHEQSLRREFVVVHQDVLKSLDYTAAKPGVDALIKDMRIVAEVRSAPPVTVGDLTDYLRMQFFHGSDQAGQRKKMNDQKSEALDAMLGRRLLNSEAVRLGVDKSTPYKDRVAGYKDSLVFDAFVQKVIVPDSKMREEEVKQHYNSHLKDYSYPGMLRVRGLAFSRRPSAEDAMRKLQEGADFGWLGANAEGQVAKGTPGLLTFDGQPVMIDSMPDPLQKALTGAKPGEFRLYASPEGPFYIVAVLQVLGSSAKAYADVREDIAQKLYGEKLKKNVETYAAKLRAQAKVETYLEKAR
jgi:hypothetical protein